jgi:chromosome partitioning protein
LSDGGPGKTTLAFNVAGAWAAQGKHIMVVDTDAQDSAQGAVAQSRSGAA